MAQTVLVADDSVASQRLFEMVLTREGFDVVTVGSGPDVLHRVKEKQPDLALIDAVMPGVDGYQICQSLKKDPQFKNLPVIMLAGAYEDIDRQRGESIVGAHAILDKPATSQVIIAKVKELLAAQQAVTAKTSVVEVVQEPTFVEEEYEFDDDSEEVDLAVESELLEEEADWEEPDEDVEEFSDDVEELDEAEGLDDVEELDEFEDIDDVAGAGISELDSDVGLDEIEAIEEIEEVNADDVFEDMFSVPQEAIASQAHVSPAVSPETFAVSNEQLDAVAEEIAKRVAAKLGPVLLQSLTAYVLQLPSVRQIVDDASKSLVQEILPDIQDSFK